jgi:hypothetical protein
MEQEDLGGTKKIFFDWYTNYICSSVLHFCQENEIAAKVLLLLDSAPGHLENLSKVRTLGHQCCLHAKKHHTTFATNGPEVIATLNAYYFCETFMEMVRVLDMSDKTIKDYWGSSDISKGINDINAAWEEVSVNYLNGVWCHLLPDFIHDFAVFEPVENTVEVISRLV